MRFIVENRKNILFILVIICFCTACGYNVDNDVVDNKEEIINEIMTYDDSLDRDFTLYIYDEYGGESLENIISYVEENGYEDRVWHKVIGKSINVLRDYYDGNIDNDNVKVLETEGDATLSFVGDVSLADNFDIMPYYDARGEGVYGILGREVVEIMNAADVMVANSEFTVSDRGAPLNKLYTFRASPERLNIYKEMGVDVVSIANNHVYDYGEEAFFDMLKYFKEYDIPYVGGGKNIDEAKRPYYIIINGYKIAFIAASRAEKNVITPEATETSSGVFWAYDPTLLIETIGEVKEDSDFVILLMHWGREDSSTLENVQVDTGKKYIEAGADIVIGSHAHVLQGMEFYNGKLISYNLGDFIFNRETKDTGILSISIDDDGNFKYKFIPCRQSNYKTTLLEGSERNRVIDKMSSYSINTTFDEDGYFYSAS